MIRNKYLSQNEIRMMAMILVLITIGHLCLYSTSHSKYMLSSGSLINHQLIWFILGCASAVALSLIPIHLLYQSAYFFYGISLVVLMIVLFIGSGPVQRWIHLGSFSIQPSEFAKITTLLAVARYLSREKGKYLNGHQIAVLSGIAVLPILLIMREPDLGTATVYMALLVACLIWGGIRLRTVGWIGLACLAFITGLNRIVFIIFISSCVIIMVVRKQPVLKTLGVLCICILPGLISPWLWSNLEPYQKHRISTFLGLHTDPTGAAYQAIQSRIAIGSGGFWGKGFMQGTQTQLRFLPEQHTDFIFSVLGEEFGFWGVLIVLICFGLLFSNILSILKRTRNRFASFILVGGVSILFYQVFINIGMALGIVPVTGLPLPFLSYGGSSLVMVFSFVGLVLNIASHRYSH